MCDYQCTSVSFYQIVESNRIEFFFPESECSTDGLLTEYCAITLYWHSPGGAVLCLWTVDTRPILMWLWQNVPTNTYWLLLCMGMNMATSNWMSIC